MTVRAARSLRTELLVKLGFVTSAAVIQVGLTTALIAEGDLGRTLWPLIALWGGSTAVFIVYGAYLVEQLVVRPLRRLAAEADSLAAGEFPPEPAGYEATELAHLGRRYRDMAADLLDVQSEVVRVEKLAGIGRLAAGVAHEVRNPLGAIGNYVEILRRRGADQDITGEMQRAIERIERIVQSLLAYAHPDAPAPAGSADLNLAVETAMSFLSAQGALRGQAVELAPEAGLAPVKGNGHALEQVVVNLVLNACQAAPGGRVVVGTAAHAFRSRHSEVRRQADQASPGRPARAWSSRPRRLQLEPGTRGALLYVADDGPGVPDRERERIFDPFYTTKPPGRGTGLGLAIVARTVHEAGGTVWVDRAREGGAAFKVFLPHAEVDVLQALEKAVPNVGVSHALAGH
jgi:signal transduction histidine kinase